MNRLKVSILLVFCAIGLTLNAQTDQKTTEKIVDAKRFTFVANYAMPQNFTDINSVFNAIPGYLQNAGNIPLSGSYYDVRITPDSVICFLPYYGRAFRASFSPDENGYKFTSTQFKYQTKKNKKGDWSINISAKDVRDSPELTLSVTKTGYASLSVISNYRQNILYQGYLKENP